MEFLLDTNFLVIPNRFRVDIFQEIRDHDPGAVFAVTGNVVNEAGKLSEARMVSALLARNNVRAVKSSEKDTDTGLLKYAKQHGSVICTNDAKLRSAYRKNGVKAVFLRERKKLDASWEW